VRSAAETCAWYRSLLTVAFRLLFMMAEAPPPREM